jgi:hypothetical protein
MTEANKTAQPLVFGSTEWLGLTFGLAEARKSATWHKPMLYPAWAPET